MAASVNKVILIGNLGANPDIRNTQSGAKVATFSLATTESWKDQSGQKQDRTEWHRVVIWGDGLVNVVAQYLHKGSKIYIEGQLRTRKWQNQQGQDQYSTEVVVSGFGGGLTMLSPSQNNRGQNQQLAQQAGTVEAQHQASPPPIADVDDDAPF